MKTLLKLFVILISSFLFTSCGAIFFGSADGTCPSFHQLYSNNESTETDSSLGEKSQQTSDLNDNNKMFVSYGAGVQVGFPIAENLRFDTGLIANFRGNKTATGSGAGKFENKINLVYFDIPLLANYQLKDGGFNFFGGLQPGILISAKSKLTTNGNSTKQKVKEQYKTLDIGAKVGGGYVFDSGIGVNIGYVHGLSNILKDDFGGKSLKVKNRLITIGVTYVFKN